MKMVYPFITLLYLLSMLASCKQDKAETPTGTASRATIKISREGTLITQYQDSQATALLDETVLTLPLELRPEGKHPLMLTINGYSTGKFAITQNPGTKTGNILYQSEDLPADKTTGAQVLLPDSGELTLSKGENNRCTGSFKANGKSQVDGKVYTIEGNFDVPVRKL